MSPERTGGRRRPVPRWLGPALSALALLYAGFVHHGIGPFPVGLDPLWYEPRSFLHGWSGLAWAFETPLRLLGVLAFPSAVLVAAVFLTTRSAVARALSLTALVAVLLFGFYGTEASRVWEFFLWRGSAVLVLTALAGGFALAAPWLAGSWLRHSWPLRLLLYAPVCFVAVAFIRNATGTDRQLAFSISPWPAVTVFGLEVGALYAMIWLLGSGLGVAGLAMRRQHPAQALLALALGVALPPLVLAGGSALHLLPFRPGAATFLAVAGACAVGILLWGLPGGARAEGLWQRARLLGWGAALIALPLVSGELWARFDYYWTREHRAREIIDAMDRYYERETLYPDELAQLIDAGDLEEIPEPAIGFGFLYDGSFSYIGFGTSYMLEFPAPRWVECAYSSSWNEMDAAPWPADDEAGDGDDPQEIDGRLAASWSCPANPPELW